MVVNQKCRMVDQLKRLCGVSTNFSPILFGKDIQVLAPDKSFHKRSVLQPPLFRVPHYIVLIQSFWKTMRWKVSHKLNSHIQGDVL